MNILDKLKTRWGIENTFQVIIILVVFACTGFAVLYVKELVFEWLGVTSEFPFWQRAIIWIVTILPAYNILLYIFGTLFGQREFFTLFLKKSLGRLIPGGNKSSSTTNP